METIAVLFVVMITMFVGSGLFVGCVLGWSFKIR